MKQDQLDGAISKIEAARQQSDYNPQDPASADALLGPAVYPTAEQATRRITPWFSAAGFGGLLIDRDSSDGRRSFTALGSTFIPDELTEHRLWQNFGNDQKAWFAYLDEAVQPIQDSSQPVETPFEAMTSEIGDDNSIYLEVQKLLTIDNASGILLVGPPGTGKTWYARQIAIKLTNGDARRIREVQFHPSYQYEDFVEGYVPDAELGFRLVDRHLLNMASLAASTSGPVVLIIDEFSRTDPARVLGEALTYMERLA